MDVHQMTSTVNSDDDAMKVTIDSGQNLPKASGF